MASDAYSALSDPTRRRILSALRNGARPVGELVEELNVSQPTVSKHLKVLRDTGLVATRAEGQKRFYSVEPQPLRDITAWIDDLLTEADQVHKAAEPRIETETADMAEAADEPRNLPWFTSVRTIEEHVVEERDHEQDREGAVVSETADPTESAPEVTGASVGATTDVVSAEPGAESDESDELNSTKPEFGIPLARSGGAHRRQSGLLSTLTGFRRRGRSSRR